MRELVLKGGSYPGMATASTGTTGEKGALAAPRGESVGKEEEQRNNSPWSHLL